MIVLIPSDISTSDTGIGIIYPLSPLFNKTEQPPTSVLKIGISKFIASRIEWGNPS